MHKYQCSKCEVKWSSANACHCTKCHLTFSGLKAFDKHLNNHGTNNITCKDVNNDKRFSVNEYGYVTLTANLVRGRRIRASKMAEQGA